MSIIKKVNGKGKEFANRSIITHDQLLGTEAYGCHPISAIRKLPEKLFTLKSRVDELENGFNNLDVHFATDEQLNNQKTLLENSIEEVENKSKGIKLEQESDNNHIKFTNYEGESASFRQGREPDDTTIGLTTDNKLRVKKIFTNSEQFSGTGLSQDEKISLKLNTNSIIADDTGLHAKALSSEDNSEYLTLSGIKTKFIELESTDANQNQDIAQINSDIESQNERLISVESLTGGTGGYLPANSFTSDTPTLSEFNTYAWEQLGKGDDIEDVYIREGSESFSQNWLSLTDGGESLQPQPEKYYNIKSDGDYKDRLYSFSTSLNKYEEKIDRNIPAQTRVVNTFGDNSILWVYTSKNQAYVWVNQGPTSVGIATNTEAGTILGSTEAGEGSVDTLGHLTIVGYNAFKESTLNSLKDKQDKYVYLRVDNGEDEVIGENNSEEDSTNIEKPTNIYVNGGAITFEHVSDMRNLKTLFIREGAVFKPSPTSTDPEERIVRINVNLKEEVLPYIVKNNMLFVGYTSGNIPLFITEEIHDALVVSNNEGTLENPIEINRPYEHVFVSYGAKVKFGENFDIRHLKSLVIWNGVTIVDNPEVTLNFYDIATFVSAGSGSFQSLPKGQALTETYYMVSLSQDNNSIYMTSESQKYLRKYIEKSWNNGEFTAKQVPFISELASDLGDDPEKVINQKKTTEELNKRIEKPSTPNEDEVLRFVNNEWIASPEQDISQLATQVKVNDQNVSTWDADTKQDKFVNVVLENNSTNLKPKSASEIDRNLKFTEFATLSSDSNFSAPNLNASNRITANKGKIYSNPVEDDDIVNKGYLNTSLQGKQEKYNMIRFNSGDNELINDDYTNIYINGGTIKFNTPSVLHNIKTLYIREGVEIKASSQITKINVDLAEKTLPYTVESSMLFVGYTVSNCPLFVSSNSSGAHSVKFVEQTLTNDQKEQARANIGAGTSDFNGSWFSLSNKPVIPSDETLVHKVGNEIISGEKIFNEPIKVDTIQNKTDGTPTRLFNQNAIQLQAGGDAVWFNSNEKSLYAETNNEIDLGTENNNFKNIYGNKLITKTIKAIPGTSENETLDFNAPGYEFNLTQTGTPSTTIDKILFTGGNTTQSPALSTFNNGVTDLGTETHKFKDLHISGKINDLTLPSGTKTILSTEDLDIELETKQDRYNFIRVNTDETQEITSNDYTDIFMYTNDSEKPAIIKFSSLDNFKNLKSFYIAKYCKIDKTDDGTLLKINVDFTEHDLPYTFTEKAYFVGFTQDNCPLFRSDLNEQILQNQSDITTNDNNAVHKTGDETIDGQKTFEEIKVKTIQAIPGTAENEPLVIKGPAIELTASETGNPSTIKDKLLISGGDSTNNPAIYSWSNNTMDLGIESNSFRDLHLGGKINNLTLPTGTKTIASTEEVETKQDKYKFKRIGSGNNLLINTSDNYTDIFAIGGTIKFESIDCFKNLKTLYINKGVTFDTTDGLSQINVDFKQLSLPYTFNKKVHFVGYTTENIPLFISGQPFEIDLGEYSSASQDQGGQLTNEQLAIYNEAEDDDLKIKIEIDGRKVTLRCQSSKEVNNSYERSFTTFNRDGDNWTCLYLSIQSNGNYTFSSKNF